MVSGLQFSRHGPASLMVRLSLGGYGDWICELTESGNHLPISVTDEQCIDSGQIGLTNIVTNDINRIGMNRLAFWLRMM